MKELILKGKKRTVLFLISLLVLMASNTCYAGVRDSAYLCANECLPAGNPLNMGVYPKGACTAITIPLKRVGKLLLIEARIGDQTGNFVFDTGACGLVLNHTYFRKALWEVEGNAGGITGCVGKIYQTRVPRIDVSDLYFEDVLADVINLGHIENRRNVKILGLFGLSLFRNLEMVIDVNRNELLLYRIDRKGKRIGEVTDTLKPTLVSPINEVSGHVFMSAYMGGKPVVFCVDTGAEANVLCCSSSRKVLNTVTITSRSSLTGSVSGQMEVIYGTMNDFVLCGQPLQPMGTMITSLESLALAYNYPLGGVLGFDFFEKGVVCINLVKKELSMCLIQKKQPVLFCLATE